MDRTPKANSVKERTDKLDFIEIKNCLGKTVSRNEKSYRLE